MWGGVCEKEEERGVRKRDNSRQGGGRLGRVRGFHGKVGSGADEKTGEGPPECSLVQGRTSLLACELVVLLGRLQEVGCSILLLEGV